MTKLRLVDKPAGAGGTKYEQLQADKAKYAAQKIKFEQRIADIEKELDRAILDGKSTDNLHTERRSLLDGIRRIELLTQDLDRLILLAEPEHIRTKIEALRNNMAKQAAQGSQEWEAYEAARKKYYAIEADYKGNAETRRAQMERWRGELLELEQRLSDLEAQHEAAN